MELYTWDEMEKEVLSPTIARKIVSGDKAMVAQVFLAKGAIVPLHHHESEQITYILEGALEFELEGRTIAACADSADGREGIDAFLNKRKPQFKGK